MAALDQGKIVLIIGGLAALLLMTLGLIWMAVVLTRRSAAHLGWGRWRSGGWSGSDGLADGCRQQPG
jgi:hypothetical protein